MGEVVLELPEHMRAELKEPLGPVYTDVDALLADAGQPLIAVGDIVTYHLLEADVYPDVALVDGRTERERVDRDVLEAIGGFDVHIEVTSPPAMLTVELLEALRSALDHEGSSVIAVDGEEDLAALPAVIAAPEGASVVYGQPGEGMVLLSVTSALKAEVRGLLEGMEGDHRALWTALEVDIDA